nr:MAG TPA: hypothetical protein [Caudoviricetes sp.]
MCVSFYCSFYSLFLWRRIFEKKSQYIRKW